MALYGDDIFAEASGYQKIVRKMVDKGLSNPIVVKGQIAGSIKTVKAKLDSIDSKEEKIAYLNKMRTGAKRGMTERQNKATTSVLKNSIAKDYQKFFDYIDSELDKLK